MVKRASLLLPALLLTGCSFFTASWFPGYLAQAEKSYDLGSSIDGFLSALGSADYRWHPQVFVLTTVADVDYGAVLIEIDSLPYKLLMLANPAGNLQQLSDPGFGRMHLRALDGRFVVGKYQFLPDALAIDAPIGGITGDNLGFSDGANNYLLSTTASQNLTSQIFTSGWTGGTSQTKVIDAYPGFELRAVFYDPLATTGREVILVFFDFVYNRVLVVFTPKSGYSGSNLTEPIMGYPQMQFTDVEGSSVIYTRKGIVLSDQNGSAVLMDFNGSETGKKLYLGQGGELRIAFDITGDHFYVFNPKDQMLYKGKTGW